MKVEVGGFRGMRPGFADTYLDAAQARYARDCRLYSGELRPIRTAVSVGSLAKAGEIRTLFRYEDGVWLHWPEDVSVVRNPTPNDPADRVFWTGEGRPKAASRSMVKAGSQHPAVSRHLGVPHPEGPPVVNITDDGDENERETRFYVYTFVTSWGWESAPSPPTPAIQIGVGGTVELSAFDSPPTGDYDWTLVRIYRLATGVDGSDYFFIGAAPVNTSAYSDGVSADSVGEAIETEGWLPPPDEMQGLVALASGAFAGFVGQTLYFSPIGVPYAYPREYSLGVEYEVVALASYENTVAVLTTGHPYLATGVDPSAMGLNKLEINQACVSARSVTSVGAYGVVYASPDGLVQLGGSEVNLLSAEYMTREEWQEYNPSSIVGVVHDGDYIGFFTRRSGQRGAFVFSPERGFYELSDLATAAYSDLETDRMYYTDGWSGTVLEFDSGAEREYLWRSKVFETTPTSFSAGRIAADYDFSSAVFRLYADGVLVFTRSVTSSEPFRLPAFGLARRWQFELEGKAPLEQALLGSSVGEVGAA